MNSQLGRKLVISRKIRFSCGVPSKASRYGSGCNYTLEVFIEGEKKETGLVISLSNVNEELKILFNRLNHKHLQFEEFQSSSKGRGGSLNEKLAIYCYEELKKKIDSKSTFVKKVRLYEGLNSWLEVPCDEDI